MTFKGVGAVLLFSVRVALRALREIVLGSVADLDQRRTKKR